MADINGVFLNSSCEFMFAPCLIRAIKILSLPFCAARCKGDLRKLSGIFGSAPFLSNNNATFVLPEN